MVTGWSRSLPSGWSSFLPSVGSKFLPSWSAAEGAVLLWWSSYEEKALWPTLADVLLSWWSSFEESMLLRRGKSLLCTKALHL